MSLARLLKSPFGKVFSLLLDRSLKMNMQNDLKGQSTRYDFLAYKNLKTSLRYDLGQFKRARVCFKDGVG